MRTSPRRAALCVLGVLLASVVIDLGLVLPAGAAPAAIAAPTAATSAPPSPLELSDVGCPGSVVVAVEGTIVVGNGVRAFVCDLGAPSPAAVDLGALDGQRSAAAAISGSIVVGSSGYPGGGGASHAFAYDLAAPAASMIDLGTFGGTQSQAVAVDGTIVVGSATTPGDAETHAFAYDLASPSPTLIDLGTLGGTDGRASAVDGSIVVGTSELASGAFDAFAYDLASPVPAMRDLGALSTFGSQAVDVAGDLVIGNSWVAGDLEDHERAFVYDLGADSPSMVDIGTLPGHLSSRAAAIDGNVVVGTSYLSDDRAAIAFAYDLGAATPAMVSLGTNGGQFSWASAIDGSVVVGFSSTLGRRFDHAFAYDLAAPEPAMVDLGALGGNISRAVAVDGTNVVGWSYTNEELSQIGLVAWSLDPRLPRVEPGSASVVEGEPGITRVEVPVTLSQPAPLPVTVRYQTMVAPGAPPGQAEPYLDYEPVTGTLVLPAGSTTGSVVIEIMGDAQPEGDEYVVISFHDPVNATVGGVWGLGFAAIQDDDQPAVIPGTATVTEGSAATTAVEVPVTLTEPSVQTVTVSWTTLVATGAPGSQADPASDYVAASGLVTFEPGQASATITLVIDADAVAEADEYLLVSFHHPTNATVRGSWGLGAVTIIDDDG